MPNEVRIDKWLWAVRLFKTRSLATAACRDGGVMVGSQPVKPSRDVRIGDMIAAKVGGVQRTLKVIGFPSGRVSAKAVSQFMEDLTPESEFQKARDAARTPQFAWPKGAGRPTKKNRRLWEKFGPDTPP